MNFHPYITENIMSSNITVVSNTRFLPIQLRLCIWMWNIEVFARLDFVFFNEVSRQRIDLICKRQDVEEEWRELFLQMWIIHFTSCNRTNKCTYVNCVYHILFITNAFITNVFLSLSRSSSGNLQEYLESKQSFKMHEWTIRCYRECLRLSIHSLKCQLMYY